MREPMTYNLAFVVKVIYSSSILKSLAKEAIKICRTAAKTYYVTKLVVFVGRVQSQTFASATCGNKMTYDITKIIPKWTKKAHLSCLFCRRNIERNSDHNQSLVFDRKNSF